MLVHFIGGPNHGRSEAIQNPSSVYRILENTEKLTAACYEGSALLPPSIVSYTEHTYRITKRTPRYAIAEWEAPKVDVVFRVRLEIDGYDSTALRALDEFTFARCSVGERKHGVKCIGADKASYAQITLLLTAEVEGPEDLVAIQLAAEKVQHYIDAELPSVKHCFVQTINA